MNKITLFSSFLIIIIVHYVAITFLYEKKMPIITKPPYQKVSVQLAQIKEPIPVKEVKEIIEKPPVIKKEVFKKPVKKKAKRKLVKKVIKKKIKKIPKKKTVEKIVKKEPVVATKPLIKEKKIAKRTVAKSLKKFKNFKSNYMTALRLEIDKNKKYPNASKRLREQGLTIISFRVLKSGIFKNIKVITSSGKKRLDKAALKALINTKKFRPFSKEINKEYMDLTLPIRFKIN